MNQRLIVLETLRTRDGVGLDVRAPSGPGAAPPGYYMLFVLDNAGTPSVARWVRVGADAPPPAVLPDPAPAPHRHADPACGPHRPARDAQAHAPRPPPERCASGSTSPAAPTSSCGSARAASSAA